MLGAAAVYFLGNSLCVSLIVALSRQESVLRIWCCNFIHTVPSFLIAGLLSMFAFELLQQPRGVSLFGATPVVCFAYYSSLLLAARSASERT